MENNLLEMSYGLGYDGEPIEMLNKLCEEHNVSDDMREKMLKQYEEGCFDW